MDVTLIESAGSKFHFPVNPEEVLIRRERQYETVSVLNKGEVDFLRGQKVREVAFSSFFPASYDASYCRYSNLPDPIDAMNVLTRLMNDKDPCRLLIPEAGINVWVVVSAHDTSLRGGEPGDVYFDVTFRTWREAKMRSIGGSAKSTAGRTDAKPVPKVYVVKAGDTLTAIAKLQLGDGGKWRTIYDKNKAVIGKDPNLIVPGQKLVMS